MQFVTDPAEMTPEQRLSEIAAILADGLLRLPTALATEKSDKRLDVTGGPTPPCDLGLTDRDPGEVRA